MDNLRVLENHHLTSDNGRRTIQNSLGDVEPDASIDLYTVQVRGRKQKDENDEIPFCLLSTDSQSLSKRSKVGYIVFIIYLKSYL